MSTRKVSLRLALAVPILVALLVGCSDDPPTDPTPDAGPQPVDAGPRTPELGACLPELIPEGGFDITETYWEVASSACAGEICMVHRFPGGDPSAYIEVDDQGRACIDATDAETCLEAGRAVADNVHCTCRCDVPDGVDEQPCACAEGYVCEEQVVTTGGTSIEGGYCVRESALLD